MASDWLWPIRVKVVSGPGRSKPVLPASRPAAITKTSEGHFVQTGGGGKQDQFFKLFFSFSILKTTLELSKD